MKNPGDKTSLPTLCKACQLLVYSNIEYASLTKYCFYSSKIAAMLKETLKAVSGSFTQKLKTYN